MQFWETDGTPLAVLPCYLYGVGNGTQLIFPTGQREEKTIRVHTYLQQLARFYAVDIRSLQQAYRQISGKANLAPLPLTPGITYIPVKMRKPLTGKDFTYGYVWLEQIKGVLGTGKKTGALLLAGDFGLPTLLTCKTLVEHLRWGYIMAGEMNRRRRVI